MCQASEDRICDSDNIEITILIGRFDKSISKRVLKVEHQLVQRKTAGHHFVVVVVVLRCFIENWMRAD